MFDIMEQDKKEIKSECKVFICKELSVFECAADEDVFNISMNS